MKKIFFALIMLFSMVAQAVPPSAAPQKGSKNLKRMIDWYLGDYNNTLQASRDTAFDKRELHVRRIWDKYRTEGTWVYAEVTAKMPEGDVFVSGRFYEFLDVSDEQFEANVYMLENNKGGNWNQDRPFDDVTPDDLTPFTDCAMVFQPKGETKFLGFTSGKECQLFHKGASSVTTDITIYETKVLQADRGFTVTGKQKWGPADGKFYEFKHNKPPVKKK